jgi:hypothetical protein
MEHTHIIINEDIGLHIVVYSDDEEIDLVSTLDDMIINEFSHA